MKIIMLGLSFSVLFLLCTNHSIAVVDSLTIEGMWLFDDVEGDTVIDSSGHERHGTIQGGVEWVDDGKFGKALEFNGVDGKVVITDYKGIGGNTSRTTVLWFKTEDDSPQALVTWGVATNTNKYYIRIHDDPSLLRVETQGGQLYSTETELNDGVWHHLAVVLPEDSDMCHDHILYVDGEVEKNTAGSNVGVDTDVSTNDVEFGSPVIPQGVITLAQGTMDEVAIFSAPLIQDDIKSIMSQGFSSLLSVSPDGKLAITWASLKSKR